MLDELSITYNPPRETVQFTYDVIERFIGTLNRATGSADVSRALAEQMPLELIRWRSLPAPVARRLCELLLKHGFDLELMLSLIRNEEYNVRRYVKMKCF